ncbi:Ribosomal RNA small subunit methyltransferase A [Candidatus Magnetaquicoccaceae bacterium FCR-1]|uniref:Ribosomal RNA small subunit methyltransferase A n=1 Tax=Candidatus Magnetaquiglobus chichijimensis TaxID=3141448 RepID=A0ABQ0C5P1_9PROT
MHATGHTHFPQAKKRLGQHFLADESIAQEIVAVSGAGPKDRVVEIGPGPGALTVWLLRACGQVWAIEFDATLVPLLENRVKGLGTLHVERADALRVDYRALATRLGGPLTIVANLPYNVGTPILMHLVEQREVIASMTVMLQTEVAERLAASPGSKAYGALSVMCGMWMCVEPLLEVPPAAFRPPPKVHSTVIRLIPRPAPLAETRNLGRFSQVVHAAFGQRRKVLANALKSIHPESRDWLTRAGIDPERRGETLSIAEFAHLTNVLDGLTGT